MATRTGADTAGDTQTLLASPHVGFEASPDASLLGLPPELRNDIYHFVAVGTSAIAFRGDKSIDHPLARTSKQIRHEFLPAFTASKLYGVATIEARIANFEVRGLYNLCRHIESPLSSIHVTLLLSDERAIDRQRKAIKDWIEWIDEREWDKEEEQRCEVCQYEVVIDTNAILNDVGMDAAMETIDSLKDYYEERHAVYLADVLTEAFVLYGLFD